MGSVATAAGRPPFKMSAAFRQRRPPLIPQVPADCGYRKFHSLLAAARAGEVTISIIVEGASRFLPEKMPICNAPVSPHIYCWTASLICLAGSKGFPRLEKRWFSLRDHLAP
jgi:hypothetical protein